LPSLPAARERSSGVRRLRVADLQALRHAARADRRSGYRIGATGIFLLVFLTGCGSRTPQQSSTGVAYAGPSVLNLRRDLGLKSQPVGTVKHGDKLDVIDTRRRFVKVRAADGTEGWTDSNLLLTPQQMDDLRLLAESAAKLPSQGTATVYDALNVHTEPTRQSSSFFQIPEAGSVEVIGHRLTPRVMQNKQLAPVVRRASAKKTKAKELRQVASGPPPPVPPGPPSDWESLSRPRATDIPGYAPRVAPVASGALDDWSLVRTHDGKAGWVLSRMLTMAIPDEVAQYAEGHRITAYLPLGEVKDKDQNQVKYNWLWTTVSSGQHPHEFDSFRVFVWSIRRHRYETAYIERNVKGYYPVEAQLVPGQEDKAFSLVLEDRDGTLYKRTYAFSGYRVRMVSKMPVEPPAELPGVRMAGGLDPVPAQPPADTNWRQKLGEWRHRWIGR